MRVCYFGTYRAEYSRNRIMIEGLRRAGVEVVECHQGLWQGFEDREKVASGGWMRPSFWLRAVRAYLRLLWRYRQVGEYDVLVVGYPGQYDVFLARLLSWLRRKPLVWDIFMSIYLIALERKLNERSPLSVRLIARIEGLACRLPDCLILDTVQYRAWFGKTYGVAAERFRLVPTGADDSVFHPLAKPSHLPSTAAKSRRFRVVYYGTFIPNHGVPTIVEAARCLQADEDIGFELIGDGPEKAVAEKLAAEYHLSNVTFTQWLSQSELVERVSTADVCLGAFGDTPQSLMTVHNKIYEGMAMAKAMISGDSPAMRDSFEHGRELYLCERGNPQALAEAIRTLRDNPALCRQLSENGYRIFREKFDLAHIGKLFAEHLREVSK